MLCYFSVENFQSIKNRATLDMRATNIKENKQKLLVDNDRKEFLPLSVIYGPNGSGKSTILSALYALGCKIMSPIYSVSPDTFQCSEVDKGVEIKPFAFDKRMKQVPTTFVLSFRSEMAEYEYELRILYDKVLYERLIRKLLPNGRYAQVFLREEDKISLKGDIKGLKVADISSNITLLTYFGILYRKNVLVDDIINWFAVKFNYIPYSNPIVELFLSNQECKYKDIILKMFQEMDLGISDYRVVEKDEHKRVYTTHIVDQESFELSFFDESSGTQKLFGLLGDVIESLKFGSTLVIDELDAKLHPVLLQYIIDLFNSKDSNPNNSQLLFTSHDLSTMNSKNFRRDEIWFTAKGIDSSTTLYSLVDFVDETGEKTRNDEKYSKRYLEGRYGADPIIRRLLNWNEVL